MEILLILALFVGIVWLVFYGVSYGTVKNIEKNQPSAAKIYLQDKDFHYVDYYGGFDDISVNGLRVTNIIFDDDCLEFDFRHDSYDEISEIRKIDYSKLKNVKYMTKTTIEEKMQLGHMLVFGVFSLGMKRKEESMKEYIVIDYEYKDEVRSIIIYVESKESKELFNKIKNKIA